MVVPGAGFLGSKDVSLRWFPFTDHVYESFWSSSLRHGYVPAISASVIGASGVIDGVYSDGSSAPQVVYQRPAL